MYGRFESGVHPRESMNDLLLASQDHTNSLEDHVTHLTKRIGYLKNLISKSARRFQNASKSKSNEADVSNDNRYYELILDQKMDEILRQLNLQYYFKIFYRFEYDKKMSELSCADEDHPLKAVESPQTTQTTQPKADSDASLEGFYFLFD